MTLAELDKLLQEQWMSISVEERFRTCGRLFQGEKAILERLAPPEYSRVEIREFVFYHMYGYEMPEGARKGYEKYLRENEATAALAKEDE
jgi:hypothetical protein